jgi:enoyl-CoA hydratase/carnithine racemase
MAELVVLEARETYALITLNRADKRNAIHWPMLQALQAAVAAAAREPRCRAIVLQGAGPCFSAGIDVASFFSVAEHFGAGWREDLVPLTRAFQHALDEVERAPMPSIALLHGHALGLGLELALACDFRIAAENTRMALPEVRLGLIPDVGGTTRLTRLVGPARAKDLILTGREISVDEAVHWGLISDRAPADALLARGEELVAQLSAGAPLAVRQAKRVIDGLFDLDRGMALEAQAQNSLIRTEDFQVGAQALMLKQRPQWKGK